MVVLVVVMCLLPHLKTFTFSLVIVVVSCIPEMIVEVQVPRQWCVVTSVMLIFLCSPS